MVKAKVTRRPPFVVLGWRSLLSAVFISLACFWIYFMQQISVSGAPAPDAEYTGRDALIRDEDAAGDGATVNGNADDELQHQQHIGKENRQPASPPVAKVSSSPPSSRSSSVLNQKFLRHLRSLKPFPKHLHILFPDKNYYKRKPPLAFVENGILRFMELNPTWNVTVHDDADMDDIIRKAAGDGIISMEEMRILLGDEKNPAAHPVERADLARMLIMWYHGGMYVDADSLTNPKNFDKVFLPTVKMCLPIYLNTNFAQSLVCSSPRNRMYMEMIKRMSRHRMTSNAGGPLERRGGWAKNTALFSMGPPMFNSVVFRIVFGRNHDGKGIIKGIKNDMKTIQEEAGDLIATGQFRNECNSFISDPFDGCKLWDREPLYKQYNMSSWGKAVKRRWAEEV